MQSILLLSGALLAGCSASADRLECSKAQPTGSAGLERETPAQIADVGARVSGGGENAVAEIASEVRARNPRASKGEIVNYLVTAYCPQVDRKTGLDVAAKRAELRAFAARAYRIVAAVPAPPA